MNTNTAVIGGIVVVLLILGGIFLYTQNNPAPVLSPVATSTPVGGTDTGAGQTPGAPVVTTGADATPYMTSASVSGFVNPEGPFTTYWFEYGTTQNFGSKSASQLVGSGYTVIGTPAYLTGLAKDTTYYYRLVAQNSFGTQPGATYSFTTGATPAPVGSAPSAKTLSATGITRTGANLSGEVNPNKAPTQFWFEYGKTQSLGVGSALQSVGSGSTAVVASLSLSTLDPATTYYFRLNAQNQFGISNGTIMSFKTAGPAATTTAAVPVVTTQVPTVATTTATLRGTVNPSGAQTTYWFEYSTDSLFGSVLLKTTPQRAVSAGADTVSVTANITALRAGTTYYYRTVAQNSAGTVRGDRITFTTK